MVSDSKTDVAGLEWELEVALADMLTAAQSYHGGDLHRARDRAMDRARRWGAARALEAVEQLSRDAFMCHSLGGMPTLIEPDPPHSDVCPGCAVESHRERLEKELES